LKQGRPKKKEALGSNYGKRTGHFVLHPGLTEFVWLRFPFFLALTRDVYTFAAVSNASAVFGSPAAEAVAPGPLPRPVSGLKP
jgi:hypothetical protein